MDDYFLSLAEELISKYRRVNHFTAHAVSIGRYHEEALKGTLRMFLPDRYSLKTGFVHIPKQQVVSRQCDIIIVDENEPNSYLFRDGEFVIVHPAAVVAVIEVKTRIDKAEFLNIHKAAKALALVRQRQSSGYKGCIYMAFGYGSAQINNDEQLAGWYQDIPSRNHEQYDPKEYPASIISLEGSLGILQLFDLDADNWGVRRIYKEESESAKWRLAVFLMMLRTVLETREHRTEFSNLDWGVDFEGAKFGVNLFRAGESLVRSPRRNQ